MFLKEFCNVSGLAFYHLCKGLSRGSVIFVSFLSSFPGFLLLLPAPGICLLFNDKSAAVVSLLTLLASSSILQYSLAFYMFSVSYFISCSLALYLINESQYRMPVIDFLGRDFTKRFLGDPKDHTIRVLVVPTLCFCLVLVMKYSSGSF